ncbi:MAG: alanine--tRNA ligase [Gammaproteobacteria bacterium]|nr:MAG: alanine--tRNA ligase [Gammaproteobacteria bacterium]
MNWTCADVRDAFLNFFKEKGHEIVESSPLVPGNDKTLLFTNAGMVQFKDTFLGQDKRSYTTATSSQRCVRAGGKHNDLENVGYTARHHTFFEMLGNFSFGDYFKQDAIKYAWEFLTEVIGLPPEKLWVTVFEEDDEAADIWLKEIGVDANRFSRIGAKDNFWAMGDTGPCGPCTEIFYDHGEDIFGGPPGTPEEDGDRYIEIWNLVFMQYNRFADGTMEPLPKPSVDTGMGLERLAAILQNVHSNYEIDLFQNLIKSAAEITGTSDLDNKSLRVIADHIRACSFLVADGVFPSNEGRGYVLRRIIRRAVRHGYQLGTKELFFYKIVDTLVKEMGEAYPILVEQQDFVKKILKQEEEQFAKTLEQGMKILETEITTMGGKIISGDTAFKLYDTYGFPFDLTADIARERELTVDRDGFDVAMEEQKKKSKESSQFDVDYNDKMETEHSTEFIGYEATTGKGTVLAIFKDGHMFDKGTSGDDIQIILDKTPFYAESGGQAGDSGELFGNGFKVRIKDTIKSHEAFLHIGTVIEGTINVRDEVATVVDGVKRQATMLNHTATHILHAALREVLGTHVQQKGSLVNADRLRFDFSHFEPVSQEQLEEIEKIANEQVRANHDADISVMPYDEATKAGAMALFGEKYGDKVRVIKLGDFSIELCGGTHAERAGDIGLIKIISETGIASGVRRIEAITGSNAMTYLWNNERKLNKLCGFLKADRENLNDKMEQLISRNRNTEKELERLKSKLASQAGGDLASNAIEINGVKVLSAKLEGADAKTMRETVDQLKNKLGTAVVVLGTVMDEGKVQLAAGVTKDLIKTIKAGDVVNHIAAQVGGRGGGKPDMALAGGSDPEKLDEALASLEEWANTNL